LAALRATVSSAVLSWRLTGVVVVSNLLCCLAS
jgi:hypothetical protein